MGRPARPPHGPVRAWKWTRSLVRRWHGPARPAAPRPCTGMEMDQAIGAPMAWPGPPGRPTALYWHGNGPGHWCADGMCRPARPPPGPVLAWKWTRSLVRRWHGPARPAAPRPCTGMEMDQVIGAPMAWAGPPGRPTALHGHGNGPGHWCADG